MALRLKTWVVISVLTVAVGTPWTLLQSVAWVKMLASYSREASFAQALKMTFDGKHPCRLCRLVQEGQKQERQQQRTCHPDDRLQLGLPPQTAFLPHPPIPQPLAQDKTLPDSWTGPPATPPPRCV